MNRKAVRRGQILVRDIRGRRSRVAAPRRVRDAQYLEERPGIFWRAAIQWKVSSPYTTVAFGAKGRSFPLIAPEMRSEDRHGWCTPLQYDLMLTDEHHLWVVGQEIRESSSA